MSDNLVTYSKVKTYVENRLDLNDEAFISTAEMLEYCEEALRYCEAEVHKLNLEDQYFESEAPLTLSTARKSYDIPSNIYGRKILRIIYNSTDKFYELGRISHQGRHIDGATADRYSVDDDYRYRLINNSANAGTKIRLYPIPTENTTTTSITANTTDGSDTITLVSGTPNVGDFLSGTGIRSGCRVESIDGTTVYMSEPASATGTSVSLTATDDLVTIHYIRRVEIPTATTDLIDFPEFWNFIAQHMVVACLKKELGNPRLTVEQLYLEELKQQMHATLSDMVPDQVGDIIEQDQGHYMEFNGG